MPRTIYTLKGLLADLQALAAISSRLSGGVTRSARHDLGLMLPEEMKVAEQLPGAVVRQGATERDFDTLHVYVDGLLVTGFTVRGARSAPLTPDEEAVLGHPAGR